MKKNKKQIRTDSKVSFTTRREVIKLAATGVIAGAIVSPASLLFAAETAQSTKKVHLVHFSPNGTTQKTLQTIASGMNGVKIIEHSLLTPASRKKQYIFDKHDLIILGFMSAGMLFGKTSEIFSCLEGNYTPMVGVITYGNGYYGVALTELKSKAE